MPLNTLGSGFPSLVAVNPSFLHSTLPSRDMMRMLSYFFRRHCNTSFFCNAFILPYFATFFKELFVNSGVEIKWSNVTLEINGPILTVESCLC